MLAQVHQGLGDMGKLAADVGGLQRVLTNVKSRGVFGEVQLARLAGTGVDAGAVRRPTSRRCRAAAERVEFAVRFPGSTGDAPVWLPIDAKFPREDYERLLDAQERAIPMARALPAMRWSAACASEATRSARSTSPRRTPPSSASCSCRPKACTPKCCAAPAWSSAAARPAHRGGRPDHAAGADDQLPDGLPHAGDREALQRESGRRWARSRPSSASSATVLDKASRSQADRGRQQDRRQPASARAAMAELGSCRAWRR